MVGTQNPDKSSTVLAYFPKMPANFVPHFLMIQASSELTRPGTCLVYSWKEDPAGFYRLNVTMTRDRIFPKEPFFSFFAFGAEALFPAAQRRENFDFSVAFNEFYFFLST